MFIALTLKSPSAPAERYLVCYVQLHAAPGSGMNIAIWSYKHTAPPEQNRSNKDDFSGKAR